VPVQVIDPLPISFCVLEGVDTTSRKNEQILGGNFIVPEKKSNQKPKKKKKKGIHRFPFQRKSGAYKYKLCGPT